MDTKSNAVTQILAQSMEELRHKTEAHAAAWGLGKTDRWDVDLDAGLIMFTNDGQVASALVQVVGTYDQLDGAWLWSWANPSIPGPLTVDARRAYEFGIEHGLKSFTDRRVLCDEVNAWEFTATACHLANAQGAYRGPSGTTMVFMTFGDVSTQLIS
jgi:hypothetical protein